MRNVGHEFGSTQAPAAFGGSTCPALKYAVMLNGRFPN